MVGAIVAVVVLFIRPKWWPASNAGATTINSSTLTMTTTTQPMNNYPTSFANPRYAGQAMHIVDEESEDVGSGTARDYPEVVDGGVFVERAGGIGKGASFC